MVGQKRPAFQFYPRDWRADTDLQTCTLAAQGLWINMLCVMHYCEPYGHLVTKKGNPMPVEKLARLTPGYTADQVDALLAELGEAGVYSQTDGGVIYSRRMVADCEAYLEHRGKKVAAGRASAASRWGTKYDTGGNRVLETDPNENVTAGNSPVETVSNPAPAPAPAPATAGGVARTPPTVDQVHEYMTQYMGRKGFTGPVPAERFHNHFTSNGWKVSGRAPMKDWKRAACNWILNDVDSGKLTKAASDASAEWHYGIYRVACREKYGSDPDWQAYLDWAADYTNEHGPELTPTFAEFKGGIPDTDKQ